VWCTSHASPIAQVLAAAAVAACRNDTIFAVKAPAGTTLEVPEPEPHQMEDGKLAQRFRCAGGRSGAALPHALRWYCSMLTLQHCCPCIWSS
jgi:hypothetical protein